MHRVVVLWALLSVTPALAAGPRLDVVVGPEAPRLERFAASELARQLKDLFDAEVKIGSTVPADVKHLILVGSPATNPVVKKLAGERWPKLSDQGHVLKSVEKTLIVGGGSPVATLWAVYELGHRFGIRYFLQGDALPVSRPTLKLDGFDVTLEPTIRLRAWRTIGDSPIGPESWGLAEQKRALGQLAKLKFNRIVLAVHAWQPFVHFEFKGVKKQTGILFRGERFPVDGDTPGRAAFRGARVFENPDFAGKTTYEGRVEAGVKLARGIIDTAHELGMTAALEFSPWEFPREFAKVLPEWMGTERFGGGMAITPGPVKWDDRGLAAAQIRAYLETYPAIDTLYIGSPEPGLLADPKLLNRKDGLPVEVARQRRFSSSVRRAVTLANRIAKVPPKDRNVALVLLLGDDHSGVLPQLATSHVDTLVGQMHKQGWAGYEARCKVSGDLNPSIYQLSRAGFEPKKPAAACDDLLTPICGEGVSNRVGKGFAMIEQATDLIDQYADLFFDPSKSMTIVANYERKDPPPAWWKKVQDLYSGAMDEMYRGITRARAGGRPILLYHAKRLEFAVGYMSALESARLAGVARSKGQTDKQIEHLEKAIESLYNALNALGEVARDNSDRGVIAVVNAHGYRPLKAELEKLEKASRKND